METRIVLIVLLIIVLVILARCIRVVQQSKAYVIERLGAFHTVWSVGLHGVWACILRFPLLIASNGWFP